MPAPGQEPQFRSTTDAPRKIVVCHPDNLVNVNRAVMALKLGDVLVRPNRYVKVDEVIVMNGDQVL